MIFDRVLCAVDESEESLVALRRLLRLVPSGTEVTAIAVLDPAITVQAGFEAATMEDDLRRGLDRNLELARAMDAPVRTRLLRGPPVSALLETIRAEDVTLVAVGSHGLRRATGIVLGAVGTAMVHEAECSVLVARDGEGVDSFPSSIVVGLDGSPESAKAASVASELHERLGVPLEAVVATGGHESDVERSRAAGLPLTVDERRPVDALAARAEPSALVVVGSRGLRGLRALGSVSERLAHSARGSVLVAR